MNLGTCSTAPARPSLKFVVAGFRKLHIEAHHTILEAELHASVPVLVVQGYLDLLAPVGVEQTLDLGARALDANGGVLGVGQSSISHQLENHVGRRFQLGQVRVAHVAKRLFFEQAHRAGVVHLQLGFKQVEVLCQ